VTGRNKIWRLAVIIPMTVILALLGWFAGDYALRWYAGDPEYGPVIITRAPAWVSTVIRFTYLAASAVFGTALGRLVFRWLEGVDERLQKMSSRDKLALLAGLFIGLSLSALISLPIIFSIPSRLISTTVTLLVGVVVTFVTTAASLSLKEEVRLFYPPPSEAAEEVVPPKNYKLLDTNVIIDGRIADVARAGFVEGTLYIPGFVLDELQHIADSADDLRRQRGKRGLDVLRLMQAEQLLEVRAYDKLAGEPDAPVDSRLVQLARAMDAAIVTNDSNLNKVASLEGVRVMNVNELANALKPVVLVGEDLPITVVREGKEPSQGVGYLDDGTMVVIAGGRRYVGETVRAQVTSVTQSTVGKMIFAQVRSDGDGSDDADGEGPSLEDEEDAPTDGPNGFANGSGSYEQRNMRPYSGRRARRPVR